jgi:bla regulator protein blaR1
LQSNKECGKRKEISVKMISNRSLFRSALSVALGIGLTAFALAQDRPIRVGGNVAQANRISWVTPVYPAEAKQNRIQGAVELEIMIDKEGRVSQLTVTSGPTELVQSATDAVQQWVYKPTLLNGEPVAVLTTVTVNYTLSQ